MKRIVLFLFSAFISLMGFSQCGLPGYFCMVDGSVVVSDGNTVSDAGGGSAYPDANFTMTLCPDTPGDVVQLSFSAFALQTSPNANNSDYLTVYDGNSTAAPSLGNYTGNSIQGLQITGTVFNATGCITLVFQDNGVANTASPGFEAQIQCTTPCANPTAGSHIVSPAPDDPALQTVNVCMNATVTFGNLGSFAEPGFNLSNFIWNFDDGTIVQNPTGASVTHSYSEPGEYVVTLTVEDDNYGDDAIGCQSLNVLPLQVLVSTFPTFSGMTDLSTCLGETVVGEVVVGDPDALPDPSQIGGGASGTTWTALPPQVVSGTSYLADGAGFSYSTSLVFDFFEAGSTLDNCDDLLNILVNMEHSYMGDLGIYITCPDGTSVNLIEWGTNGGGGTYLGEAVDDDGITPGVGYDYYWEPDATNGVWGENLPGGFGGSLPSGTYEAAGDLCDLVGCPLNGEWTFSVTDNLAIDNGYIFYWGLAFNPLLYPGVTTFTPQIGAGADSSYWVTSGPLVVGEEWITDINASADIISISPEVAGVYEYTYVVINDFGCQFDSTITVTIEEAAQVNAGPDQLYSCGAVQLQGSLSGIQPVDCADAGAYTYCYDAFDFYQVTYCPDNAGEGVVSITFLEGSTGANDFINVYDGPDTWPSPYIGGFVGDLTGLTWTSTSASGCLTFYISEWDGVDNCADGSTTEWNYVVTCGSVEEANFVWNWNPGTPLDVPSLQNPNVVDISQTTTFTLEGYPAGHPACASTDEVVVSVDPLGDPGLDTGLTICSTDAAFSLIDELNGTPVSTGVWYDPNDVVVADGQFDPLTDEAGSYMYSVEFGNCEAHAVLTIDMAGPTLIDIPNDTLICALGTVNMDLYDLDNGQPAFVYTWTYDGTSVSALPSATFVPENSGEVCLTVLDACAYSITECFNVEVKPQIDVVFEADTTASCWPEDFTLLNLVDPTFYTSSQWDFADGAVFNNTDNVVKLFETPGIFTVKLTLTNELGCSYEATYSDYLTSYAPPIAKYTNDNQPTNVFSPEINFTDASNGDIAQYEWIFGDGLGVSGSANPSFTFPNDVGAIYNVQLTVTDIHNCTDIVHGIIDIDDLFQVYVPNTFTPNGDGVNDVLTVQGADIDNDRFKFQVFSRNGDKVFETNDYNKAWTGEVREGDYFAPDGIYNWIAVVVSKSTGEKRTLKGDIRIIR